MLVPTSQHFTDESSQKGHGLFANGRAGLPSGPEGRFLGDMSEGAFPEWIDAGKKWGESLGTNEPTLSWELASGND